MNRKINDLRSALEYIKTIPGQYLECSKEADPDCQITGIYHKVGARGTTIRPTKIGPMMMFSNLKGWPGRSLCIGALSSRERVAYLLGAKPEQLGRIYLEAMADAKAPIEIPQADAKCQEEVYLASDPDFDLRNIVPSVVSTPGDAAPFITMGLLYAADPDNPDVRNATIHRVGIQGKDLLSIGFGGNRHIGAFKEKAFAKGKPLQLSINIGLDPAVYLASCFEAPTTPLGYDELQIAGGMRKEAVRITKCKSIDAYCIANAEYVIEGELVPDLMLEEDMTTGSGKALPEFHGYRGKARKSPGFRVTAVTCRHKPILQICIGSSDEHVNMMGLPSEASVLQFMDKSFPGFVKNVYCPPSGGGKLNIIMQVCKQNLKEEGYQRHAAVSAIAVLPEVKNVILVDEDVDIFDAYDVEWALTTRFRPDKDLLVLPGMRGAIGDPTGKQYYDSTQPDDGFSYKAIYDATCPFVNKEVMARPHFMEVDVQSFLEEV